MKPPVLIACAALAGPLIGNVAATPEDLPKVCTSALQGDTESMGELRKMGQAGLDALLSHHSKLVTGLREGRVAMDDEQALALRRAADAVARQRDAHASGLFWFTDFDAAKAEAEKTGRRILTLRMLGNLDEEFSCANSRFFRTVLYANAGVSRELREHYVLHWKSVRPAPRITIDMGDGRRIQRTITGNSIHYVLNADGIVIDALPGLYGPQAFLEALQRSKSKLAGSKEWHGTEADRLCMSWLEDAVRTGIYGANRMHELDGSSQSAAAKAALLSTLKASAFPSLPLAPQQGQGRAAPSDPPAVTIRPPKIKSVLQPSMPMARDALYPQEFSPSKGMVERPILKQTMPHPGEQAGSQHDDAASWLVQKMQRIIFPRVKFEGATLEEAVDYLRIKERDLETDEPDPKKRGVNIIVSPGTDPIVARITMDLQNVPLSEALRYTAEAAGMKLSFEGGRVVISPDPANDPAKRSIIPAIVAAERADAKSMVERPILNKTMAAAAGKAAVVSDPFGGPPVQPAAPQTPLAERMTPALWNAIAVRHAQDTRLDAASRRFMMSKLPPDDIKPAERAAGDVVDERTPFARTLRRFEMSVAEDTVKNEYLFHTQIHQWLEEDADGKLARDVDVLNKRVYAELFLTPDYDEWLGLVPEDTYTALEKDGCACDKGALPMRRR